MEKIPSVETLKATGVEGAADAFLLSAETKETLKKEGGVLIKTQTGSLTRLLKHVKRWPV